MKEKLLEDLYKKNAHDIYRYCYFRLGNKQDAEDIVSDTFIEAYKADLNNISNHRPWLFKVARNTMYDKHFRKNNLESPMEDSDINQADFETSSLEKIAITEETIAIIKEELTKLDPEVAEVLSLRLWEELKFSEISEITGNKEDTVKKQFYRGLEKLKLNVNSKPGVQLKSFTLPVIAAGILAYGNSGYFTLSGNSMATIAASIASNLNITSFFMNDTLTTAASGAAKTATAGFFSTTAAKIIVGTVGTVTAIGGGVGGAVAINEYNKSNSITPVSYVQEEVNEDESTSGSESDQNEVTYSEFTFSNRVNYCGNTSNSEYRYTMTIPSDATFTVGDGQVEYGSVANNDFKLTFASGCDSNNEFTNYTTSVGNTFAQVNAASIGAQGAMSLSRLKSNVGLFSDNTFFYSSMVGDMQPCSSGLTAPCASTNIGFSAGDAMTELFRLLCEANSEESAQKCDEVVKTLKVELVPTSAEVPPVAPSTEIRYVAFQITSGNNTFGVDFNIALPVGAQIAYDQSNPYGPRANITTSQFNISLGYYLTLQGETPDSHVSIGNNAEFGEILRATFGTRNLYSVRQGVPTSLTHGSFTGNLTVECTSGSLSECEAAVRSIDLI